TFQFVEGLAGVSTALFLSAPSASVPGVSVTLRVDRHSFNGSIGVEHCFGQRGMRVDGEHQLVDSSFEFHHSNGFGDEFRRLRANDMYAKNLAVLRVGHNLHKAIVAADNGRLGVTRERKLADLDLEAALSGLCFRQTSRADLRVTIRA